MRILISLIASLLVVSFTQAKCVEKGTVFVKKVDEKKIEIVMNRLNLNSRKIEVEAFPNSKKLLKSYLVVELEYDKKCLKDCKGKVLKVIKVQNPLEKHLRFSENCH